ncbi:MAG TPA: hypothetical protein VJL29_14450 [Thermoguttaceae bacterium]|nr:hypothetical protein [Thermoguttaceae bacterium]
MNRGRLGDSQGAIADYTTVIDTHDAPAEVRELARRALRGGKNSSVRNFARRALEAFRGWSCRRRLKKGSRKEDKGDGSQSQS